VNAGLPTQSSEQVPDISMATTDIVFGHGSALMLAKQLDSFNEHSLFLDRFRILGRTDRCRGGASLSLPSLQQYSVLKAVKLPLN
jgi:hypothetical protein